MLKIYLRRKTFILEMYIISFHNVPDNVQYAISHMMVEKLREMGE